MNGRDKYRKSTIIVRSKNSHCTVADCIVESVAVKRNTQQMELLCEFMEAGGSFVKS